MYRRQIKRIFDLAAVLIGLLPLLPIFGALSIAVVLSMGRPIFFRQRRIGRGERPFLVWKFRTMLPEHDSSGCFRTPLERITRTAWWIRRLSLDELPQIFNILAGEMSLVGPRPLPAEHVSFMTTEERRRHSVLPGITGWSQVHAVGSAEPSRRLALDVWYVDHVALRTDIAVILKTASVVLSRSTAVHDTGFVTLDRRT
jgi:lipopolysaccharide/colanic/teichoic acid biosynthesis glycosyltransferase